MHLPWASFRVWWWVSIVEAVQVPPEEVVVELFEHWHWDSLSLALSFAVRSRSQPRQKCFGERRTASFPAVCGAPEDLKEVVVGPYHYSTTAGGTLRKFFFSKKLTEEDHHWMMYRPGYSITQESGSANILPNSCIYQRAIGTVFRRYNVLDNCANLHIV